MRIATVHQIATLLAEDRTLAARRESIAEQLRRMDEAAGHLRLEGLRIADRREQIIVELHQLLEPEGR